MQNVESVKDVLTMEELVRERDFYEPETEREKCSSKNSRV